MAQPGSQFPDRPRARRRQALCRRYRSARRNRHRVEGESPSAIPRQARNGSTMWRATAKASRLRLRLGDQYHLASEGRKASRLGSPTTRSTRRTDFTSRATRCIVAPFGAMAEKGKEAKLATLLKVSLSDKSIKKARHRARLRQSRRHRADRARRLSRHRLGLRTALPGRRARQCRAAARSSSGDGRPDLSA